MTVGKRPLVTYRTLPFEPYARRVRDHDSAPLLDRQKAANHGKGEVAKTAHVDNTVAAVNPTEQGGTKQN